jgi:hypothetical protein
MNRLRRATASVCRRDSRRFGGHVCFVVRFDRTRMRAEAGRHVTSPTRRKQSDSPIETRFDDASAAPIRMAKANHFCRFARVRSISGVRARLRAGIFNSAISSVTAVRVVPARAQNRRPRKRRVGSRCDHKLSRNPFVMHVSCLARGGARRRRNARRRSCTIRMHNASMA